MSTCGGRGALRAHQMACVQWGHMPTDLPVNSLALSAKLNHPHPGNADQ